MSIENETLDRDAEQLRALGYTSKFDRTMSKWENFSLGFTFLSPVVGVYSVFASGLIVGGPPMFWSYLLVGLFQLQVCLVLGEIVSQFPISGGLYSWARRLVGKRWSWMTGWVYAWALCVTMSAVATAAAPFAAQLFGLNLSPGVLTAVALAMIAVTTVLNLSGTRLLARVAMFGFICELIGAVAVGGYLVLFARRQPLGILFDSMGAQIDGHYLLAFAASAVSAMYCYYGFEACGDVAEETPNASRIIPKAMRLTIYVGGAAAMFVCLALVLAEPDLGAVMTGRDKNPVATTLLTALGTRGFKAVIAVVLVSFASALVSLQAAASRLLFAYARDQMIFGSRYLGALSPRAHVPAGALLVAGFAPALISLCGLWLRNAIATAISFAAIGIYLAFQMVILAALIARAKGWRPAGPFSLGRWGWPANVIALLYGIGAIADMAWPRNPQDPWYSNYAMIVTSACVLTFGLIYMALGKLYDHGNAPAGDAHLVHLNASLHESRSRKLGLSQEQNPERSVAIAHFDANRVIRLSEPFDDPEVRDEQLSTDDAPPHRL